MTQKERRLFLIRALLEEEPRWASRAVNCSSTRPLVKAILSID